MPLQRVTSLRRRAQANAPAASYWSCRIVDGAGAVTGRVHREKGAGEGDCNSPLLVRAAHIVCGVGFV